MIRNQSLSISKSLYELIYGQNSFTYEFKTSQFQGGKGSVNPRHLAQAVEGSKRENLVWNRGVIHLFGSLGAPQGIRAKRGTAIDTFGDIF